MGPNADPFILRTYAATLAKQERRMISNRTKDAVRPRKQPQGKRTALRPDRLRGGILERTEFGHSGDSTLSCQDSNSRPPFTRDPVPFLIPRTAIEIERRERCPVGDQKLIEDVMKMPFDRTVRDVQPSPNRLIR